MQQPSIVHDQGTACLFSSAAPSRPSLTGRLSGTLINFIASATPYGRPLPLALGFYGTPRNSLISPCCDFCSLVMVGIFLLPVYSFFIVVWLHVPTVEVLTITGPLALLFFGSGVYAVRANRRIFSNSKRAISIK